MKINKKLKLFLIEIVEVVAIAVLPLFISSHFLARPFVVSGSSMEPNFQHSNYLIVDIISYFFDDPQRGDVVVFKYPLAPSNYYIKRVIGVPHDKVSYSRNNIFVNGSLIEEDYLREADIEVESVSKGELVLGDDEYFVLGDNRNRDQSSDSRSWGPVPRKNIVGVVKFRVWPPFKVYKNPNKND